MTDASGSTIWSYDERGRVISEAKTITGGGTFTTAWTYNSADLPVTMTYPGGEEVDYGYNDRMLLDTLGSYVTGTDYDDAGRVTARALGNGLTQEFGYYPWDAQNAQGGRLASISPGTMQNLEYSYDPAGNITEIENSVAAETQGYEYDALDRLTEWRVNGNLSGQYAYNPSSGNLTGKGTTALSYAPVPGNPGVNGLAAWWSLNETSGTRTDSHGTNPLTDNGAVPSAAGVQGKAASFVSTATRYLTAPDSAALSTGNIDFTIRAHVYLNSLTGTRIVATKGEKSDMTKRDFTLFYDGASHFAFRVGNGSTQSVVVSGTVTTGRWYTVTAWHDAAANTLNIQLDNGTPVSVSYTYGAMDTTQPMSVGAFADGTFLLDGRIDELALYKRVLTANERTWLYNNGKGRSYADLGAQLHAVTAAVTNGGCPQGEVCDYDQAQTGVNNTYTYDNNGNQITRTINGVTLTLAYDAEGRMVSVTGQGITASFTYDGDGKRVKSVINSETTYFVGSHYEVSGGVVTKYYFAGSQRVAMKVGTSIYYLLSDHLGSTSLTTDSNGSVVSEMRYSAWGGVRYSWGTTPTGYTFTGQYSDSYINLLDYVSRRYDPEIGRFISPDSIVPGPFNPQAYDHYAYTFNNPIIYTDPSGHDPIPDFITGFFFEAVRTVAWFSPKHQEAFGMRSGESDAMLMGRLVADVASIVAGAELTATGTGGAIAGAGACAVTAGAGCIAGGAAAVAGGVVLAGEGVGIGLRGAEGLVTIMAALSKRDAGEGVWGGNSGKQTRTINGYKVRIDWESPGENGNVHITVNGEKIYITDPSDLSELPKGLRNNEWIRLQINRAFKQLTEFERSNNPGP